MLSTEKVNRILYKSVEERGLIRTGLFGLCKCKYVIMLPCNGTILFGTKLLHYMNTKQ